MARTTKPETAPVEVNGPTVETDETDHVTFDTLLAVWNAAHVIDRQRLLFVDYVAEDGTVTVTRDGGLNVCTLVPSRLNDPNVTDPDGLRYDRPAFKIVGYNSDDVEVTRMSEESVADHKTGMGRKTAIQNATAALRNAQNWIVAQRTTKTVTKLTQAEELAQIRAELEAERAKNAALEAERSAQAK